MSRWEVQRFVRKKRQCSSDVTSALISDYLSVEKHLKAAHQSLHFGFHYETDVQFRNPVVDPYGLYLLNSLYHLCACVLYSSIEPILSACSADTQISSQVLCTSDPEAIRHSNLMSKMSAAFMDAGLDHSRLSPAVGYSAFMSCLVRATPRYAQENPPPYELRVQSHSGAMDILKRLKEYWKPLQRLVCCFTFE